jgi:thioredoxin reductase
VFNVINSVSRGVSGFLSRDGIDPAELRRIAHQELATYDTVRLRRAHLRTIHGQRGRFIATFSDGTEETARTLLVATGLVNDLPEIPGLRELWGTSVFHCRFCDGWEARDRQIAVLSLPHNDPQLLLLAVLGLARLSDDVTWCTNGAEPDHIVQRLLAAHHVALRPEPVAELVGHNGQLERIVFSSGQSLPSQAAFIEPAWRQHSDLATQLGCQTLDDGTIAVDDFGRTSVTGVYAAGDMAKRPTMPIPGAQAIIAAAGGAIAGIGLDIELLTQQTT